MAVVAVAVAVAAAAVVIQLTTTTTTTTKIIIDLHRHFGSATSPCGPSPLFHPSARTASKSIVAKIYVQNLTLPIGRFVAIFFLFFSIVVQTVAFPSSSTSLPLSSLSLCVSLRLLIVLASLLKLKTKVAFALAISPSQPDPPRFAPFEKIYALAQLLFFFFDFFLVFFCLVYFARKQDTSDFFSIGFPLDMQDLCKTFRFI